MSLREKQRIETHECVFEIEGAGGSKARLHLKATSLDEQRLGFVIMCALEAFLRQSQWNQSNEQAKKAKASRRSVLDNNR